MKQIVRRFGKTFSQLNFFHFSCFQAGKTERWFWAELSAHISGICAETQAWYLILHGTSPFRCFSDHMFTDSAYFCSFAAGLALFALLILRWSFLAGSFHPMTNWSIKNALYEKSVRRRKSISNEKPSSSPLAQGSLAWRWLNLDRAPLLPVQICPVASLTRHTTTFDLFLWNVWLTLFFEEIQRKKNRKPCSSKKDVTLWLWRKQKSWSKTTKL